MTAAITLGLLSALFYGATDFLARFAGKAVGVLRTMFYGQLLAAAIVSLWLATQSHVAGPRSGDAAAWVITIAANFVILTATALLYRALERGSLAIVAPVTASYGAVTALLSLLAGEHFTLMTLTGITLAVIGAILAAKPPAPAGGCEQRPGPTGALPAAGAACCYGFGFWLQGRYSVPALGPLLPVWSYYLTGLVLLFVIAALGRRDLRPPTRGEAPVVFATGALAGAAYLALVAGQATGAVAVATVLSSLASAVTVLMARFILSERISLHGWIGLAAILFGLALIKL